MFGVDLVLGRILLAWTMALVRPALRHSWRKAELRIPGAAGLRPKATLERPTVVWQLGNSPGDAADAFDGFDGETADFFLAGTTGKISGSK